MGITTNELPALVGKVLVVQVAIRDSDDEDYREVRGKCLIANGSGLVIQTRSRSEMIAMPDIIDIDLEPKVRRLARRWIGVIGVEVVRQHLLDRHGYPFDLVKNMDAKVANEVHEKLGHGRLGHEHGERPARRAGRPKKEAS